MALCVITTYAPTLWRPCDRNFVLIQQNHKKEDDKSSKDEKNKHKKNVHMASRQSACSKSNGYVLPYLTYACFLSHINYN